MRFSHEASQAAVFKALRAWSLTTLPFALALITPRTKLVLSSEGAHSPVRASMGQKHNAGCLPQRSTSACFENLGARTPSSVRLLVPIGHVHHPPRPGTGKREGSGGLGEEPGDSGSSSKALLCGPAFLFQPAYVVVTFTLEQLVSDHQQPPGQRDRRRLLATLAHHAIEPGPQRLRGFLFVGSHHVGDLHPHGPQFTPPLAADRAVFGSFAALPHGRHRPV